MLENPVEVAFIVCGGVDVRIRVPLTSSGSLRLCSVERPVLFRLNRIGGICRSLQGALAESPQKHASFTVFNTS